MCISCRPLTTTTGAARSEASRRGHKVARFRQRGPIVHCQRPEFFPRYGEKRGPPRRAEREVDHFARPSLHVGYNGMNAGPAFPSLHVEDNDYCFILAVGGESWRGIPRVCGRGGSGQEFQFPLLGLDGAGTLNPAQ